MGNHWTVGDNVRRSAADRGVAGAATATAAAKESMDAAAKQAVPLKVMVFVDGTWLYYSFFGRFVLFRLLRCFVRKGSGGGGGRARGQRGGWGGGVVECLPRTNDTARLN